MAVASMYLGMRMEGLVGRVEKTSQWEVTCSVGGRNDAVERARKAFDIIAHHDTGDFLDSYRG